MGGNYRDKPRSSAWVEVQLQFRWLNLFGVQVSHADYSPQRLYTDIRRLSNIIQTHECNSTGYDEAESKWQHKTPIYSETTFRFYSWIKGVWVQLAH